MNPEQEFLYAIDYELTRCARYGDMFSVVILKAVNLLADQEQHLEIKDQTRNIAEFIRKSLRIADNIHILNTSSFGIILPCTYEAGAESVALRLKKGLSSAFSGDDNSPLASIAGICSSAAEPGQTSRRIYDTAVATLEREKISQAWFVEPVSSDTGRDAGCVVVCTDNKVKYKDIASKIQEYGYVVYMAENPADMADVMLSRTYAIGIVDHNHASEFDDTLKKIRKQEKEGAGYYFFMGIGELDESLYDIVVPVSRKKETIIQYIKRTIEYMALKQQAEICQQMKKALGSIRFMTHQMGQPLQVMLGNAELLKLKIEDENAMKYLDNIRMSIVTLSDMNMKISRLAKLQKK
jgi:GGDEF domain-containing protein